MTRPEWPTEVQQANRGKPHSADETAKVEATRRQRQAAFAVLDRPWISRCAGEDGKQFIGGLNAYYPDRQNHGSLSREFRQSRRRVHRQAMVDRRRPRIDHMTQEAYAGGYFRPSDFGDVADKAIANVVWSERASGRSCPGRRLQLVIAGLDPAIHLASKKMDARVSPAYDDLG